MPIATCFIKDRNIDEKMLQQMTEEWAKAINVEVKDISLTVVFDFIQGGQNYGALVNLYLPSLWSRGDALRIQKSLCRIIGARLKLKEAEIFIITSIIEPGYVLENGQAVEW